MSQVMIRISTLMRSNAEVAYELPTVWVVLIMVVVVAMTECCLRYI